MRFTRLIHYNRIRFFHTLSKIESRAEFNKTSKVQINYSGPVTGFGRYPNAGDGETILQNGRIPASLIVKALFTRFVTHE
jgi:hypothetical protein